MSNTLYYELLEKLNNEYANNHSQETKKKIVELVEERLCIEAKERMAHHVSIIKNKILGYQVLFFLSLTLGINLLGVIIFQAVCVSGVITYFIRKYIGILASMIYFKNAIMSDVFNTYWEEKSSFELIGNDTKRRFITK